VTGVLVDLGSVPAHTAAAVAAPVQNPEPPPGQGEEFGKSSPVGLVVVVLLAVATVVIVRSMTRRLKRLPESFDQPRSGPDPGDDRPGLDAEDAPGPRT
jgi:hypothetical protein